MAIGNLEPGDMFLVNLVKAQASLLNNLIDFSQDAEEQSSEASLLEMVRGLKEVLV